MANLLLLAAGAAAHEAPEPSALGLLPGAWVALAMLVLIGVMFKAKVPGIITKGLDSSIAEIRQQLDEAKALRAEAEALRQQYAARITSAEKDAAQMLAHAKAEAEAIVARAEADTTAVIARREKMAAEKIEAAERAAVADLRVKVAEAATVAATSLIKSHHGSDADARLVDTAIGGL